MKALPSLKQLEYLVALDDQQHFGHAAEACHVTPSTVSAGIKELEDLLTVTLAERDKRSVLMTPVGRQIAERGRQLLRDAEEIVALAASAEKAPLTGELRLGVIPTVGPFLLPKVLPAIWRKYPDLRLYLYEEQTDDLLAMLRRGDIDAALIALPYDVDDLEATILFEDRFQFACSKDHFLASRKRVKPRDMEDVSLLLLREGHCLRGHALEACELEQPDRMDAFAATSLYTLVHMVAANLGVTLLPQLALDGGINKIANLSIIPFVTPSMRRIGLVWRRSTYRGDDFELLGREMTP